MRVNRYFTLFRTCIEAYNDLTGGVCIRAALLSRKECLPMNLVFEILNAYAAVATVLSFLHDLWTDYKNARRSREGSTEELK